VMENNLCLCVNRRIYVDIPEQKNLCRYSWTEESMSIFLFSFLLHLSQISTIIWKEWDSDCGHYLDRTFTNFLAFFNFSFFYTVLVSFFLSYKVSKTFK
jgi:hypothetical protein